jgi:hypothetical protein
LKTFDLHYRSEGAEEEAARGTSIGSEYCAALTVRHHPLGVFPRAEVLDAFGVPIVH